MLRLRKAFCKHAFTARNRELLRSKAVPEKGQVRWRKKKSRKVKSIFGSHLVFAPKRGLG